MGRRIVLTAAGLLVCLLMGSDEPSGARKARDPYYRVHIGDVAYVCTINIEWAERPTDCACTAEGYALYLRACDKAALNAVRVGEGSDVKHPDDGVTSLKDLRAKGTIVRIAYGTQAKVVREVDRKKAGISRWESKSIPVYQVQVLAGPFKARKVFVGANHLTQLVSPEALPSDSEALVMYRRAVERETTNKDAALLFYQKIFIEYPRTCEAEFSAERIKALGGRLPYVSEVIAASQRRAADSVSTSGTSSSETGSHLCGATTKKGTPCMNRVKGVGYCHLHR